MKRQTKISEYFQVSKNALEKESLLAFDQIPILYSEDYSDVSDDDIINSQLIGSDSDHINMVNKVSDITFFLESITKNYNYSLDYKCKNNKNVNTSPIVDWIIQICNIVNYQMKTIHIAVSLLYKLLEYINLNTENLHLLSLTCIWMAAKLEEFDKFDLSIIKKVCNCSFSDSEFTNAEIKIYEALNGRIISPTFFDFIYPLLYEIGKTELYKAAMPLSELALYNQELHSFNQLNIAVGIICVILHEDLELLRLSQLSKCSEKDILKCAKIFVNGALKTIGEIGKLRAASEILKVNGCTLTKLLDTSYRFLHQR